MELIKELLVAKAVAKYGIIFPCNENPDWTEMFTIHENILMFWYNTMDNSTHMECVILTHKDEVKKPCSDYSTRK